MPKKSTEAPAVRLGDRLVALRTAKDLSQIEVAKKAGITTRTLYRYESVVKTKPKLDILKAIAKALGVELKELL